MPYPAKAVANYILDLAESEGEPISPMKLVKLVYLAHGWHLAIVDAPLLDEFPEAWKYGPVVPRVYHEFKRFGSSPITSRAKRLRKHVRGRYRLEPFELPQDVPIQTLSVIDAVWEEYKRFSPIKLSAMTHQAGTPWEETNRKHPFRRDADIPDDLIKEHFQKLEKRG